MGFVIIVNIMCCFFGVYDFILAEKWNIFRRLGVIHGYKYGIVW